MRRSRMIVIVLAVLLTFGFTAHEAREIARGRASLAAQRDLLTTQQQQLDDLRRLRDEAQHDLKSAAEILANEKTAPTAETTEKAAQIDGWITRAKRLKKSFEEHPEQCIPEFQLLTELDWLTLARGAKLESQEDLRRAWTETRDTAFSKLAPIFQSALRDFAAAGKGAPPSELSQLLPYLKLPIDPDIMQRYEIANRFNYGPRAIGGVITERAPVDVDFDTRHTLSLTGRGSGTSLWALESFRQAYEDAMREFSTANPERRPDGNADLLPYLRDPAAKAIYEAQLTYAKDNQRESGKTADLRPYVTDPAARNLLEKMISDEERRAVQ